MPLVEIRSLSANDSRLADLADLELSGPDLEFSGGTLNGIVERVKRSPNPEEHLLFSINHGDELVGFLNLREGSVRPHWAAGGTMTLHHLRIASPWTGRGFGRAAIVACARWIVRYRPDTACLALSVNEGNERAIALYLRCGFVPTRTKLGGRLGPEIVMQARLVELAAHQDSAHQGRV